LLAGGPAMGPAVLFWGILAVVIVIALALGRSRLTPLRSWQWILLGIGVATINLYALAIVAVWLLALNQRGKLVQLPSPAGFKWMQTALFGLSLLALGLLLTSIPLGLLSEPQMHITGNGSYAGMLSWYQDRGAHMAEAWVISLPMWSYRLAMLLWSLWLAFALIDWCKWAWQQLGYQALWYVPGSEPVNTPKTKASEISVITEKTDDDKPV